MVTPVAQSDPVAVEHFDGIPIRNIWLLMLYASDLFKQTRQREDILSEKNPDDIPELVAELLARAVEQRLRRNLTHGYQPTRAIVSRVRGRINHLETQAKQLLSRGVIACEFEHFTADTVRNQFVRSALDAMAGLVTKRTLAHRCRRLSQGMERIGVSRNRPSRSDIATERFGRHDADDRLMVDVATLALDLTIPTRQAGGQKISHFERGNLRMLYERAVGGFYRTVLPGQEWTVKTGEWIHWPAESPTAGMMDWLPGMQTDITLLHRPTQRRIVIDTKFTSILTKNQYGQERFKSGYLYQMYAYLRSQEDRSPSHKTAEGILLHPSKGMTVDESMMIQGHRLRLATVDLSGSTGDIRKRLLEIVDGS
jgi:5-methylcytosine-specific restriction enzyme subunit McrC